MSSPERLSAPIGEGEIAGWRHANVGAPRLLFCHANGFCASAYKRMLALLADRFDIYEARLPLTLSGGNHDDTFNLGMGINDTNMISAPVSAFGNGGSDTLNLGNGNA